MGSAWSKSPTWFGPSPPKNGKVNDVPIPKSAGVDTRKLATQFVYKRRGSMYADEDGDLAHEFYEEVKVDNSQTTRMERRLDNLKPQGMVDYPIPRLHPEFPVAMYSPIEKH